MQKFEFESSGEWCFNGGSSTVLPIELEGFIAGNNNITFGADMTEKHPLIEWISVVVDKDNPTRAAYIYIHILHSIARAFINGDLRYMLACSYFHTFVFNYFI